MTCKCKACGKENPDYAVYCGVCGNEFVKAGDATATGSAATGSALVCERCGGPLESPGPCPHCAEPYPKRMPLFRSAPVNTPLTIIGAIVTAIGVASLVHAIIFGVTWLYINSLISYSGVFDEVGDIVVLYLVSFFVLGVLAVFGGLSAIGRGSLRWALVGAAASAVAGFFLGTPVLVAGIVCVILTVMSRDEF